MNHGISEIKTENIRAVLDALGDEGALTRSELARRCHLSLTTVGKIIDGLWSLDICRQESAASCDGGRIPRRIRLSERARLVLFRLEDPAWTMELLDFHLRPTHRIRVCPMPDRDPSEQLRAFLLRCRRELDGHRRQIKLCGLVTECGWLDEATAARAVEEYVGLPIEARDHTTSALARAALHMGLAAQDGCTIVLLDPDDGRLGGAVIRNGEVREGTTVADTASAHGAARLIDTLNLLSAVLAPDTLLLCTAHPTERLRAGLAAAVSLPHPLRIEVRDADEILTLGFGLALREAWLAAAIRQEREIDSRNHRDDQPSLRMAEPSR